MSTLDETQTRLHLLADTIIKRDTQKQHTITEETKNSKKRPAENVLVGGSSKKLRVEIQQPQLPLRKRVISKPVTSTPIQINNRDNSNTNNSEFEELKKAYGKAIEQIDKLTNENRELQQIANHQNTSIDQIQFERELLERDKRLFEQRLQLQHEREQFEREKQYERERQMERERYLLEQQKRFTYSQSYVAIPPPPPSVLLSPPTTTTTTSIISTKSRTTTTNTPFVAYSSARDYQHLFKKSV
jgi:hypothetical protein